MELDEAIAGCPDGRAHVPAGGRGEPAGDRPIGLDDLPPHLQAWQKLPTQFDIPDAGINLEELEKKLVHRAIHKAGGNKSKAAKLLGITRRKLYSMLERLG
jgi:DNA-binding NtrC family response regulator